jgi:hypothetical protein
LVRIGRKKSLAEVLETSLGTLITGLSMTQMFPQQAKIVPKFPEVASQAAQALDDFLSALFKKAEAEPPHKQKGKGKKQNKCNRT